MLIIKYRKLILIAVLFYLFILMTSQKLIEIFKNECNYEKINEISKIKMRNSTNGIQLDDAILYRFFYSKKDMTKERIVSYINNINQTTFTRQAFESKESSIPIETYLNLFLKIQNYYNCSYSNENNFKLIAIDGTYNNDPLMNEILNMGVFDVSNGVPIDIKSYGKENKNREIASATNYIRKNIDVFKNNIIVGDRGYFSYEFFNFLIANDLKFIIRVKGNSKLLNPMDELKSKANKHNLIFDIKNYTRVIEYKGILHKTFYASKSKKEVKKYELEIKNDCVLVTNLLYEKTYTKEKVLDLYKQRWDIEVFFKLIKNNFKFQHMTEKSATVYRKMYLIELIIIYLANIIEKYYQEIRPIKKSEKGLIYKINKTNLINGIFDFLLYNILKSKLTDSVLNEFCKAYIKIIQNKNNRTFPRTSKTPFDKWYIKGYSDLTKYLSIINAFLNNKIHELNKNLQVIARRILTVNGKKYGE